jgi:photosynthetic reaction center cytochrome c subunit
MTLRFLFLAVLAAGFVVAQEPAPPRGQMPDPNKPAGEAFKNVQLLKDVPAGQFFGAMQQISASLGVQCNFCHVQNDFASDEKMEKKTARSMITMVKSINQQFFDGKMEVRCYTCHHGAAEPVSKPPANDAHGVAPKP